MKWVFRFFQFQFSILLLLFCFPLDASAQINITTSDFLKKATTDPSLSQHQIQMDFLNSSNADLPVIDKLEFRTQSNENDLKQQEYRIRLSPSGRKERRENRRFQEAIVAQKQTESRKILHDVLLDHYYLLVRWRNLRHSRPLLQQQQLILQDRIEVLKKQAETIGIEVQQLISAEDSYHQLERTLLTQEIELTHLNQLLEKKWQTEESLQLDTSQWINLSQIQRLVDTLQTLSPTHPDLVRYQSEITVIESEKRLEIAQEKQWLDFIEARYQRENKAPIGDEFSIGLGIEIPLKNQARIQLHELELERLEEQQDLVLKKMDLEEDIQTIRHELQGLFQQYNLIAQQLEESQAQYALEQFRKMTNADPLALLKIQESVVRRRMELQRIENQVFKTYLALLDYSGVVSDLPFKNYLHQNLEKL